MSDETRSDPLPEEWLPEPAGPPAGAPEWEARVQRIVRAARPGLERLRAGAAGGAGGRAGDGLPARWTDLGRLLRPAAGLAAAAALLLFALRPAPAGEPPASPTLAAVASGGEPAALWQAAGAEAHPVLALIALEEEEEAP